MNKSISLSLFFFVFIILFSCKSPQKALQLEVPNQIRIGFYNVENLFDTIDLAEKIDEEFTPSSRKQWNSERYFKKLEDLSKIIDAIEFPALLGLCEVENKTVLKDLTSTNRMKKFGYSYVHFESPDARGIDVALIYQTKIFKVLSSEKIRIDFPKSVIGDDPYTTRDILHVKGVFGNNEILHVFVNHFPSRRGGLEKSEPKRVYVAKQLRNAVDKIFANNTNANILIMGDFNDETNNKSIAETLNAKMPSNNLSPKSLINCSAKLDDQGKGTYNFRGNWNMLDQIIVSNPLTQNGNKLKVGNLGIFQEEWMMFKSDKNGWTPNRTYGGPNYYGGYSDHLPIYVDVMLGK